MDVFVRRTRAITLWLLAFCSIVGAVAVVSLLFSAGRMVTASDAELVLLMLMMVLPMATVAAVRNDRKSLT